MLNCIHAIFTEVTEFESLKILNSFFSFIAVNIDSQSTDAKGQGQNQRADREGYVLVKLELTAAYNLRTISHNFTRTHICIQLAQLLYIYSKVIRNCP